MPLDDLKVVSLVEDGTGVSEKLKVRVTKYFHMSREKWSPFKFVARYKSAVNGDFEKPASQRTVGVVTIWEVMK